LPFTSKPAVKSIKIFVKVEEQLAGILKADNRVIQSASTATSQKGGESKIKSKGMWAQGPV